MNTKNEKRQEKGREMLSQKAFKSIDCKPNSKSLQDLHLQFTLFSKLILI